MPRRSGRLLLAIPFAVVAADEPMPFLGIEARETVLGLAEPHPPLGKALEQLIASPDKDRFKTMLAHADLAGAEFVSPFEEVLAHPDEDLRCYAMIAFEQFGLRSLKLMENLKHASLRTRLIAARSCGAVGQREAIPTLVSMLGTEGGAQAAVALGLLGTDALPALLPLLASPDASIRIHALYVLERLGGGFEAATILPLLDDPEENVRINAVDALSALGKCATAKPILERLPSWEGQILVHAVSALGDFKDIAAIPAILPFLQNEDPALRIAAVGSLGQLGDSATATLLIPLLEDEDAEVRQQAYYSFFRLRPRDPGSWIRRFLKDPDLLDEGLIALVDLGPETSVPHLLPLLNEGDDVRRDYAAWSLARLGRAKEALPVLREVLKHPNEHRRSGAVRAMAECGQDAIDLVLPTLDDPFHEVRSAAADTLAKLAGQSWPKGRAGVAPARRWRDHQRLHQDGQDRIRP